MVFDSILGSSMLIYWQKSALLICSARPQGAFKSCACLVSQLKASHYASSHSSSSSSSCPAACHLTSSPSALGACTT